MTKIMVAKLSVGMLAKAHRSTARAVLSVTVLAAFLIVSSSILSGYSHQVGILLKIGKNSDTLIVHTESADCLLNSQFEVASVKLPADQNIGQTQAFYLEMASLVIGNFSRPVVLYFTNLTQQWGQLEDQPDEYPTSSFLLSTDIKQTLTTYGNPSNLHGSLMLDTWSAEDCRITSTEAVIESEFDLPFFSPINLTAARYSTDVPHGAIFVDDQFCSSAQNGIASFIQIRLKNDAVASRTALKIQDCLVEGLVVSTWIPADAFLDSLAREVEIILEWTSLFLAVLIIINIHNTMGLIVLDSHREIKILRSLGMSSISVTIMFETMALLISLASWMMAIIAGLALTNLVSAAVELLSTLPFIPVRMSRTQAVQTLLLTSGASLTGALVSAYKAGFDKRMVVAS